MEEKKEKEAEEEEEKKKEENKEITANTPGNIRIPLQDLRPDSVCFRLDLLWCLSCRFIATPLLLSLSLLRFLRLGGGEVVEEERMLMSSVERES